MVKTFIYFYVNLVLLILGSESAKILGVFPIPSISHQVVFRPVMIELAKRGHEVTVITTDPALPKGRTLPNFTEIDMHDISYSYWNKFSDEHENVDDQLKLTAMTAAAVTRTFAEQLQSDEVQKLIRDKSRKFDLLLIDALARPALIFSHFYDIPVISFSSLNGVWGICRKMGATTHPFIYPEAIHTRIHNLTMWEKLSEVYLYLTTSSIYKKSLPSENEMIKRFFGNTPDLKELERNIQMFFVNVHPMWDNNRPVPPNVVYLGGLHTKPPAELPQDLKSFLDSSKTGVIYVSFGTNVAASMFPADRLRILTNVFSKLPYDVLFKWDKDELEGRSDNVRIFKWLPQADLLHHPNVKLFITQCGQQSTDEALMAGVPLIGIPIFGDQAFNAEQYMKFKIGRKLLMESMTEETLKDAIENIIGDKSYRENIVKLRNLITDQPQTSLERAVWWTEYVLRNGAAHLRAPSALMHWTEYYELNLVLLILGAAFLILLIVIFVTSYVILKIRNKTTKYKTH